jgi:PAS domain S-box-containing protein
MAVAGVACGMTLAGKGPIVAATGSESAQMLVVQAFVAANFLTGLPVAAILAGHDRMMDELQTGKERLELLARNISDAVLRCDLDGVCIYASPSVNEVLGVRPDDLLGRPVTDSVREDAREGVAIALDRLVSGQSGRERITYRRRHDGPDGAPAFIEADCAIATAEPGGKRVGIVVAARDVTDRIELEALLTAARRRSEEAARAKSEFLANMSHEIRTPMNGMLGFAELMLQGDLDSEQRRHAGLIVESGRSMMLLLNDVLDLSKIEAGEIAIDHAPVDLHATLSDCAALHRPSAEKKGLEFAFQPRCDGDSECHCDSQGGPWIMTDALRLRQIALNLIANAVKFTESGRVEISYSVERGMARIQVKDSGIGISEARLETIFQPFTQGSPETAGRYGGTGLGLSISRQLAELLGGRIEVESEAGRGSRFTLVMPAPLARPEARPVPAVAPPEPEALPQAARVLLAEDHDINRELVGEMLERCGQSVEFAHDGNEAISMVIDSVMRDRPFDLVLMDVQMPGCDGYAATRAIRAEGIGPESLPILALTANAFAEDVADARSAGMQAHLAKPVQFAALARALQRWLPTRIVEAAPSALDQPIPALDAAEEIGTDSDHTEGKDGDPRTYPGGSDRRSSALRRRWHARRSEALEAVREALEQGLLGDDGGSDRLSDGTDEPAAKGTLARKLHRLAGTAALFSEARLGDQAAALERALVMEYSGVLQESLARQLLALAEKTGTAQETTARNTRG